MLISKVYYKNIRKAIIEIQLLKFNIIVLVDVCVIHVREEKKLKINIEAT